MFFDMYIARFTLLAVGLFLLTACPKDDPKPKDEDKTSYTFGNTTFNIGTDAATKKPSVSIKDGGDGIGTRTLSKDTVYILENLVFVNSGQKLTIQAGTIVKGSTGQTALIVARGGSINATGTASAPIIFTYKDDAVDNKASVNLRGQWGGVILLGKARLNTSPNEKSIEGIPTSEERGKYGGTDDADNSGILKYVSIRHGGVDIGAGNEINGLTLGGVGNKTTIEFVEVIANKDDGIEFFGGTVNTKWLVIGLCGDDAVDYDQGYRGMNQFVFVYQNKEGDRAGEHDGGTEPETGQPFAIPQFYNATYYSVDGTGRALTFRDNAGGHYVNSFFINFEKGIDIELLKDDQDSYKQFQDNNLKFTNNVMDKIKGSAFVVNVGDGVSAADSAAAQQALDLYLGTNLNLSGSVTFDNYVPTGSPATTNLATPPSNSFYTQAKYRGAFEPGKTKWMNGWTLLNRSGTVK